MPLVGTLIGAEAVNYVADVNRLRSNIVPGYNRYVASTDVRVAASPDACNCDGTQLIPVYEIFKYSATTLWEYFNTASLEEAINYGQTPKPHIEFYCAKTQGQCGATEVLRK